MLEQYIYSLHDCIYRGTWYEGTILQHKSHSIFVAMQDNLTPRWSSSDAIQNRSSVHYLFYIATEEYFGVKCLAFLAQVYHTINSHESFSLILPHMEVPRQ